MDDERDGETSVLVTLTIPVTLARQWEDLRQRARIQGGATTEAAQMAAIIAWAQAEAARRSRD